MVLFITGVPGSGKTYFAVDYLYDSFVNKKSKHFGENVRFVTNINSFNYDIFNFAGSEFNLDDFKLKLIDLYNLKQSGVDDNVLIDRCKEYQIDNTLFVLDECHNFLDEEIKSFVWWFSYHRHLHQNILLITQSLELVNKKYFQFSEFFYVAQASSLRIFGSIFRYKVFTSPKLYKKTEVKGFTLRFKKDVYNLYRSGANQQSNKVIFYFIFFGIVIFFVFFFLVNLISNSWSSTNETSSVASLNTIDNNLSLNNYISHSRELYKALCFKNYCVVDDKVHIDIEALSSIVNKLNLEISYTNSNTRYFEFYFLIDNDKKYFLGLQ